MVKKEVSFPIGCAVIFVAAFWAFEIISVPPSVAPAPQRQVAVVAESVVAVPSIAPIANAPIVPGSLPKVAMLALKKTAAKSKPKPKPVAATAATAASIAAPAAMTAQSLLDATTLSLKERFDGPYEAVLTTNAGGGKNVVWGLDATALGGSGSSLPPFSVSSACDPLPTMPTPDMSDQNPAFAVRAPYRCMITATPLSGNDRRSRSKEFPFTTGPGQFIVTKPSAMNTLLVDDKNEGGFVFTNQDADAVTVTAIDLAVSYTALNLNSANGPFILRFMDPTTDSSLADYPLENLPADPAHPYTQSASDIAIPLSFTVPPGTQKMLPLAVLGVNRLQISGVDPTIAITMKGVTTNGSDAKIILSATQIAWSCVVPVGAYDPNATSGPFATGEACR